MPRRASRILQSRIHQSSTSSVLMWPCEWKWSRRRGRMEKDSNYSVTVSRVEETAADTRFVRSLTLAVKRDVEGSAVPDSISRGASLFEYLVHSAKTEELGTSLEELSKPKKERMLSMTNETRVALRMQNAPSLSGSEHRKLKGSAPTAGKIY